MGKMAALLAAGAWPGAQAAETSDKAPDTPVQPIRFVAANDFHHEEEACDPWMTALFQQISRTEKAAFCLGLGDLANTGKKESLLAMKRLSALANMPFYPSPGNHDNDLSPVEGWYSEIFPACRNHLVKLGGWQIVIIDSTEGKKFSGVSISETTMKWLDETLPTMDPRAPTVLATHFPLAAAVKMCPVNAEKVLERFAGLNLRGVFGGHFHGRTTNPHRDIHLVTNACVARVRNNHDGSPDKGYLVVDGDAAGNLRTEFVVFKGV